MGVLTFGVVFEQVKTRLQEAQEEKGGKVTCWASKTSKRCLGPVRAA